MKATNYCHIFPLESDKLKIDDSVLIFNAMTTALAVIETENFKKFNNFKKYGTPIDDYDLEHQLREGGFLLADNYDELAELRIRNSKGRYRNNALNITIAPTSDCNFRCTYCYEKNVIRSSYITNEVMEGLKRMVDDWIPHIKNFSVTWYGGEPLLCVNEIHSLSQYFIQECDSHNVEYSAGIVTNGYLLSRKTVEILNQAKVTFYQVTLDGSKENHNKRRPLANGDETYDVILNNLLELADILPNISIRVNVDKDNYQAADDIYDLIVKNGLQDKYETYLGRILNDTNDPHLELVCFNSAEFALSDLKYTKNHNDEKYMSKYPHLIGNYCGADSICSFVIDSDGMLYKCWNEVGQPKFAIGSILNNKFEGNLELQNNYLQFDPTNDVKCSNCNILPICMGGCPYQRINRSTSCSVYKTNLDNYITYIANNKLRDRELK